MPSSNATTLRDEIQRMEKELLDKKKRLAELKHNTPREKFDDYTFRTQDGSEIKLSDMFGDSRDLILVHNMGKRCRYCTLWADGFNGLYHHLENRAGFVVISPDDPATQKEFASGRGWKFKMYSCSENSFAEDSGFKKDDGYWPGVSTFRKEDDGTINRIAYAFFGPGDDFCSAWHFYDLLAGGAEDWEPQYEY